MKKLKILIVGAGITGERHARAQRDYGSDVSFFDISPNKAEYFANKLNVGFVTNLDEGINWSDLVQICTPDDLHTEVAEFAIKAQKSVFCEKPLTTSLKDAEKLEKLVDKNHVHFLVGNNYRLTPPFIEIKKLIDSQKLGKVISLRTTYLHDMRSYLKKTRWRHDQNFLYGGAIHPIDLMYWIMEEEIMDVSCTVGKKLIRSYNNAQDYHITLTFKSGVVADVWANARVILPIHKTDLEVYCENGTLIANNRTNSYRSFTYKQKNKNFENKLTRFGWRYTVPKEVEILNKFITKQSKSHWPLPDIHEAVKVIRILDNIEKSIKSST